MTHSSQQPFFRASAPPRLRAEFLILCALPLLAPGARGQVLPMEKVFEPLAAVYAASHPTGLTTSHSGRYVYAGEGGMLAVLEPTDEASMRVEIKRFHVSSRGVLPVAMELDPLADVEDGTQDANDLLYVAAGRDGLWVLRADPRVGEPNPAVRIDDSGNTDPSSQHGRRWACDLEFATVGGVDYLLCLFAKADQSRLRLYRLADLRALAGAAQGETGFELAPTLQVILNDNPATTTDWHSFAFGMAVDQLPAEPQSEAADVYVALGAHGLVRVRLTPPQSGAIPSHVREAGPWFGDGSPYAAASPPGFGGVSFQPLVYDDLRFWNRAQSPPLLERSHPPIFTDVAVHGGYVYAAVESCGWVRFDLSQGWAPSLAIDHHEGWQHPLGLGAGSDAEVLLSLVDPAGDPKTRTWTRRLTVAETSCGPLLAVTTFPLRLSFWPGVRTEGRSVRPHDLAVDHLTPAATLGMDGRLIYTLLYDLSGPAPFTAGVANHDLVVSVGGEEVFVPPVQGPCAGSDTLWRFVTSPRFAGVDDTDELGGYLLGPATSTPGPDLKHSTYRVESRFDGHPNQQTEIWVRGSADARGLFCRTVGASAVDPRIVITSSNDAGVKQDGPLWTCTGRVKVGTAPDLNDPHDPAYLLGGILWNPLGQWSAAAPGEAYFWGGMRDGWALTHYSVGANLCGGGTQLQPARKKYARILSPDDRLEYPGRGYYSMGTRSAGYDAHYASHPGNAGRRLIFGSRMGSDWGIVVMRVDVLEGELDTAPTNGSDIDPEAIGAVVANLVTHAEFSGLLDASQYPGNIRFIPNNKLTGRVNTLAPRVFELPGEDPGVSRWLLAAPAGAVALPPDASYIPPGQEPPAPFDTYFQHGQIRIVDITDVTGLDEDGSPNLPAWTILCSELGSFIGHLEVITHGGKSFLFAADVGGELLVYDISDLASVLPGALTPEPLAPFTTFPAFARFQVSDDLTDRKSSNLYSIALDLAEWTDAYGDHEALYVYLGVSRVGVEILRFEPGASAGDRLVHVGIVQTAGETEGLSIRTDPDSGKRQLMIANTIAGIRILDYVP